MSLFNFLCFGTGTGAAANPGATPTKGGNYSFLIIIVLMFVVMYFFTIRPQKKKQKEEQEMRDNINVGDEITTIGGICGRVVNVKEDSVVFETGPDRSKMKITRWAIQTNNTANERLQAEREAAKEAAQNSKDGGGETRRRFGRKKSSEAETELQKEKSEAAKESTEE